MLGTKRLRRRLLVLLGKGKVEREMDEEMRLHLDMETQDLVRGGMSAEQARREALLRFGGVERFKEEARDARGVRWLEEVVADARFALRWLGRSPGFTAATVLTLALGIGANTAIFSVVQATLLRPLPFHEPERVVSVWMGERGNSISKSQLADLQGRTGSLQGVAGYSGWSFGLTGVDRPEKLNGVKATANLFSALGSRAALGRTFLPEDGEPGRASAVLSHGLWQRRFGGAAGVLGTTLTLNGRAVPVVGVMPPGFAFPGPRAELWVSTPLDPADADDYTAAYLSVVGRLRPGVSPEQAQGELRSLGRQLAASSPDRYEEGFGSVATVVPLRQDLVGETGTALTLLMGAVGFVLLIACANVANLLLARAAAREREMSIRTALGAPAARIVRQLLTESVLLALGGGALGLLVAAWALRSLPAALPVELPGAERVEVDSGVLAFTLAVSTLSGILFGLAPALRTRRANQGSALTERAGTGSRSGVQRVLIVAEFALALVLVAAAGLMLRSFWRLSNEDPGFQARGVLSLSLSPSTEEYPEAAQQDAYWDRVTGTVGALPGVDAVGAIHLLPLGGSNWNSSLRAEGHRKSPEPALEEVDWRVVAGDYFAAMRIPLRRGRLFGEQDRADAPAVALVNETLARRAFGTQDPIGRRISTGFEGKGNWATIVGVVGDTRDQTLGGEARPQVYRPGRQSFPFEMSLMVRTDGPPERLAPSVREAIWSVDRDVPISEVQPLADVVSTSVARPRVLMLLLTAFGVLGLTLGAVGMYGVMSYAVAQRGREFGVRVALGADTRDVLVHVLGQGARLTLVGLGIGVGGAFALTRLLASQLHEVPPTDPATLGTVALILALAGVAACVVPAWRASRADPMIALRSE